MIALGYTAFCGTQAAYQTPVVLNDINKIELSNGVFDDLYISKDVSQETVPLNTEWNWDTILNAKFNGNLLAGNVDFTLSQISKIRCKYREENKSEWITFDEVPIAGLQDLSFERYIRYNKSNTNYDIATVSVSSDGRTEGNYNITSIYSSFEGVFILDKDQSFYGINYEITPTRTKQFAILNPLEGRYPIVISNTENNYESLAVKGMFIQYNNGIYDKAGAWKYRDSLKDNLYNGIPKILKDQSGRMFLCTISSDISEDSSNFNLQGYTLVNFTMTEIGDASNQQNLFDAGLIDVDPAYELG